MDDKKTEQPTEQIVVDTTSPVSQSVEEKKEIQQPEQQNTPAPESNETFDKLVRKFQIIAFIAIGCFLVWYLIITPTVSFKQSEKLVEQAAKEYFEHNYTKLPTGERMATVTLQELFRKSYLEDDIYIPHTKEPCSLEESWVKVRRENGEYKYYTYLQCGLHKSSVDHEGPKITLEGEKEITIGKGEKYKEPGVKSVVDKKDGKLNTKDVVIKNSALNVNEPGEYEITYTAVDNMKNKTTVTRTVKVIEKLSSIIKEDTKDVGKYVGKDPKNYIYFSGMLFRILDKDGKNIRIISNEDISNVNYDGIEKWLDYFYDNLSEGAQKLIVKNEYCNMNVDEQTKYSTECTSKTKKLKMYIPSIADIDGSKDETGNWIEPKSISWTSNRKNHVEGEVESAYVTREHFFGVYYQEKFISEPTTMNYGVRPVITIKDVVIKSGTGSYETPYEIGETPKGKPDDKLNTRYSGEYVMYSGMLWRIVDINDDGTVKAISNDTLKKGGQNITTAYNTKSEAKIYNPNENGNIGYFIKNRASEFVETSYFVNKNIEVPIYKNDIQYGKEVKTKKYKSKLSAPNMYELFSAFVYKDDSMQSYWYINSSEQKFIKASITDIGVARTNPIYDYEEHGVRVVGNFHKNVIIKKGKGTLNNPYNITK